jgi:hypothetical protein
VFVITIPFLSPLYSLPPFHPLLPPSHTLPLSGSCLSSLLPAHLLHFPWLSLSPNKLARSLSVSLSHTCTWTLKHADLARSLSICHTGSALKAYRERKRERERERERKRERKRERERERLIMMIGPRLVSRARKSVLHAEEEKEGGGRVRKQGVPTLALTVLSRHHWRSCHCPRHSRSRDL